MVVGIQSFSLRISYGLLYLSINLSLITNNKGTHYLPPLQYKYKI